MASTSARTIGQKDHGDYISLLPDCLIHHIFSFLPTRDVVKTCVLSKRWQSIWTTISNLKFSVSSYDDSFVNRVLTLYMWPKVEKFHLDIRSKYFYPFKIDLWVHFAIDHDVEELLLNLNWWAYYTLSPLLYNCSSLTKLCLTGCHFSSSQRISWSSLKSLSIQNMKVSDDVLQQIFMGSPAIEYLNLKRCWGVERICSRSLKELVLDDVNVEFPLETFSPPLEIWTPRLLSLRVRGYIYEIIRILEASSLVEAELDFDSAELDCSFLKESLGKLQNATRIQLGAWCIWVMGLLKVEDVQFSLSNCKSLTLHMTIPQFSFPAIANMLATSPNLEKLDVFDRDYRNVDHQSSWHIKKFQSWAQHLQNFEIFGFYACLRFKYEEVLMLVKYLLGHASVLENMVINITSCKLLEVARLIQSYDRASEHAAVILNCLEDGLGKQRHEGGRVTTKCLCIDNKYA
ncbi:F-box protein At5g03100 [Eucalyptus grandis]|uniref:F-box protein At5g03100 n=1 Tax=Eucalyptus grandis TaxID=71139 RepID=UPI00192EE404|nr:F-box protein At5g03100 [Eucalyptus grandis]